MPCIWFVINFNIDQQVVRRAQGWGSTSVEHFSELDVKKRSRWFVRCPIVLGTWVGSCCILHDTCSTDQNKCGIRCVSSDCWKLFPCSRTRCTCTSILTSNYTITLSCMSPVVLHVNQHHLCPEHCSAPFVIILATGKQYALQAR